MIDINKRFEDEANKFVNEAIKDIPLKNKKLEEHLKMIVVMSLKQGFIYGVSSIKQTTEVLLESIKK